MSDAATELKLEVTRDLPFGPERVFDAWLDAKMLARFMTPGEGMTVPEAETDPRAGGRFRIVMQAPDGTQIPHSGTYLTVDRPRQIQFTWESPYSVDDSTVTLDFAAQDGGTRVTLTHVRFPDEQTRDNHAGGWNGILAALEGALS